MAKYYGDIAKSAKGEDWERNETRARDEGGVARDRARARREGKTLGDVSTHRVRGFAKKMNDICTTERLTTRAIACVDLFTGGFAYDHKFSFDAKTAGTVRDGRAIARAMRRDFERARDELVRGELRR